MSGLILGTKSITLEGHHAQTHPGPRHNPNPTSIGFKGPQHQRHDPLLSSHSSNKTPFHTPKPAHVPSLRLLTLQAPPAIIRSYISILLPAIMSHVPATILVHVSLTATATSFSISATDTTTLWYSANTLACSEVCVFL